MDDAELLRQEIRAAREELVRKRSQRTEESTEAETRLPLMPDRDDEFLRLALMSVDELETHIERLERDLEDFEEGSRTPDE
ncbi:hypothetical protein [Natronorubrum daqingense]|uniref:Uncharacterized protein n=1 Tax=Natronorubrum daqingense TaxID=588898 RepID=A0A1N7BTX6_9EURY|nr:hypothetical protein [Natronorubrum daqingense]APX96595.1 hypothetical protein BB347_08180 [Natronorubrum daqingense]SIR54683.1 hypothetical protein SAMN05421809_1352 [Natronorubrum daqingense]